MEWKRKKIFDDGNLKFEIELINGQRNGIGKVYYPNGKLKFEGKYINGQKNGEGKAYFKDGKVEFEGEYLNDKSWNGKGYNKNGLMTYQIKDGIFYNLVK